MADTKIINAVFRELVIMITQLCSDFSNVDSGLQEIFHTQYPSEEVKADIQNCTSIQTGRKRDIMMNNPSYGQLFEKDGDLPGRLCNPYLMVKCLPDIIGICLSYMKTRYSLTKQIDPKIFVQELQVV
jgi:hypothetical protein